MEVIYHDTSRIQEVEDFIQAWHNEGDHIYCQSSGSTGKPKTLALAKTDMRTSARITLQHLNIPSGAKAGLALSTETIAGKMMVVRALVGDLTLHVLPIKTEPLLNLALSLDFIAMVPLQAYQSIKSASPALRSATVLVGGAPLTRVQFDAIQAFWKKAYHTYGMTETLSHVALRAFSEGHDAPFCALPGFTFSQKEEQLVIHTNDLSFGTFETSDIVTLIDPQRFHFLGRKDFIINVNGIKVNPEIVEEALSAFIRSSFVVCPYHDEKYGQSLGIVFEEEIPDGIRVILHGSPLPSFYIPRKFQVHRSFIKTNSGKLDRRSLWEATDNYEWKPLL